MQLSLIVAMDRNGLIGSESGLPWHLPGDLRRFRDLTLGKPIIMGRTTHEQIGRPLPGRHNIVLSRKDVAFPGCTVASTFEDGLRIARPEGDEVFVIGGGNVYREAVARAGRIYLTIVDGRFSGTTWFPIDEFERFAWSETARQSFCSDDRNAYSHLFLVLDRVDSQTGGSARFDLRAALSGPIAKSDSSLSVAPADSARRPAAEDSAR
jgi:dihydrofolate reductase